MDESKRWLFAWTVVVLLLSTVSTPASAQVVCPVPELVSGLRLPLGIAQSAHGNLLVSETGTVTPNTGRISIIDVAGNRWTLLDGLPSGLNDINEPSGPAGLYLHGRTLYLVIGVGDLTIAGPAPGTNLAGGTPSELP